MHYYNYRVKPLVFAAMLGLLLAFLPLTVSTGNSGRPQSVVLNVPHVLQVPTGEWDDPRQRDGCEEASILMAMAWLNGGGVPAEEARRDIINMSEYQKTLHGYFEDSSAADTAKLLKEYYGHDGALLRYDISIDDIKNAVAQGHPVLVPFNARLMHHPMYKNGPPRHTLVVVGYDEGLSELIVHDPLYRSGSYVRVNEQELQNALWDYASGKHLPHPVKRSAMIEIIR